MSTFSVTESNDYATIKSLFVDYSQIKGAEGCFVSFEKELADLQSFYQGGALYLGYEDETPVACIAIKKIDDSTCEIKRLYVKPEHRGKGYSRQMLNAALQRAQKLGFTTKNSTSKYYTPDYKYFNITNAPIYTEEMCKKKTLFLSV